MDEKETNVAPEAPAPETAKTAEIVAAPAPPASSPGAAIAAADETTVSTVIRIVREYLLANPPEIPAAQVDELKTEILAHVSALVTPIVAKSAEAVTPSAAQFQPAAEAASVEHVLVIGDPVKVWTDAERKTFLTGIVDKVHDGGHAFDVTLDDARTVTKVPADGLEFDDRR